MEFTYGHHRAVSILLQVNANPNLQADDGVTPLYMSSSVYSMVTLLQSVFFLTCQCHLNLQRDDGGLHVSPKGNFDTVSIRRYKRKPIPIFRKRMVLRLCTWQPRRDILIQSVFFYKQMPIPIFKQMMVYTSVDSSSQ